MTATVLSLFTGAGGLDLGFHAAGLRTAAAVEMDPVACRTLRKNQSSEHPWEVLEGRIEDFPPEKVLSEAQLKPQAADVLIGGPPCQPFSKSGYWHSGDSARLSDPRAATLYEYLRLLRHAKPRAFLLENVAGIGYSGKSEGIRFLMDEVQRINDEEGTNYSFNAALLRATDFGVPQSRERVFIVGHIEGRRFEFPEPTHFGDDGPVKPNTRNRFRTAWDALGDLKGEPPDIEETPVRGKWADLLPSIPEGENYLWHTDRRGGLPLFGWRRRYWSFLLKLAKNLPSWTITAQPGPAIGPFHWESRRLARRELLALQTFPSAYKVEGSLADVQRQLGNAVPSALAEVLARAIRSQLLDHEGVSPNATLIPPAKREVPAAHPPAEVPKKYANLVGDHSPHPGTGKGYAAEKREASAA